MVRNVIEVEKPCPISRSHRPSSEIQPDGEVMKGRETEKKRYGNVNIFDLEHHAKSVGEEKVDGARVHALVDDRPKRKLCAEGRESGGSVSVLM